jgi:hypothetical protein
MDNGEASVEKLRGTLRDLERLIIRHQLFDRSHLKPGKATDDVPAKPLLYVALGLRTASDASEALGWAVKTWLAGAPCRVAEPRYDIAILVRECVDEAPVLGGKDADAPGGIRVVDKRDPVRILGHELGRVDGFQLKLDCPRGLGRDELR